MDERCEYCDEDATTLDASGEALVCDACAEREPVDSYGSDRFGLERSEWNSLGEEWGWYE